MKTFPPLILVISLGLFAYSFMQGPIMKISTEHALEIIERDYLRQDLTEKEKEDYDFVRGWIFWNQKGSYGAYEATMKSLFAIVIISSIQNLLLLIKFLKNRRPNKSVVTTPDAARPTS